MSEQPDIRWKMDPEAAGMRREVLLEGPAFLEREMEEGRHKGAQAAISRHGRPVVEYAVGEAAPGVPMTPDSLTAWFSASKPVTAMAIALLYDRGLLALDDPVRRHIPEFGNGKEACTIRHVLTHMGGFPGAIHREDGLGWDELIAVICAHPAEYPPRHTGRLSRGLGLVRAGGDRAAAGRPLHRRLRRGGTLRAAGHG